MLNLKNYGKTLMAPALSAIEPSTGYPRRGHRPSSRYSTTVEAERGYYAYLATRVMPRLTEIASMMQTLHAVYVRRVGEVYHWIPSAPTGISDGKT